MGFQRSHGGFPATPESRLAETGPARSYRFSTGFCIPQALRYVDEFSFRRAKPEIERKGGFLPITGSVIGVHRPYLMKISKTALWLSVIDALLVLTASASGILLKSIYARETPSWAAEGMGQDIVNLVAGVALVIAAYGVNKGSVKAFLVWSGVLLYLLYAYIIYAFDVHLNRLFLVYVAILGLSFYALVVSVIHLHLDSLHASFSAKIPARLVSVFFLVLGLVFSLLWLLEEIPALVTGTIPPSVTQANLPTNPVHILDLGLSLPAMLMTALLLWRRKLLGSLLAGPLLVFSILTGTAILVIFLVMSSQGMPTSVGVEAFIATIIVVSLVLSWLFLRAVK
jgi:hypothetical protein